MSFNADELRRVLSDLHSDVELDVESYDVFDAGISSATMRRVIEIFGDALALRGDMIRYFDAAGWLYTNTEMSKPSASLKRLWEYDHYLADLAADCESRLRKTH